MCDLLLCFVTFPCGVLGQVWLLIVSIPDLCLLTHFYDAISWSVISDCAGQEVAIYDLIFTFYKLQTQF